MQFRKCLAQFLGSFVLAAPDDGNTTDNKEFTMHRHFACPRWPRCSPAPFPSGPPTRRLKAAPYYLEQQPHNLYPPAGGFYRMEGFSIR